MTQDKLQFYEGTKLMMKLVHHSSHYLPGYKEHRAKWSGENLVTELLELMLIWSAKVCVPANAQQLPQVPWSSGGTK